jgi:hypothetical protein
MLCLAIGVAHPDFLVDVLSQEQISGWHQYWKARPFGHWIDTQMRASIAASNTTGKMDDFIPRVEEIRDLTDEELMLRMPGGAGAAAFLNSLNKEQANGDNQNA